MIAVVALSTVPTPDGLTPESSPSIVIFSLARARREFQAPGSSPGQALEEWLLGEETGHLPLHEVEREQERRGREIQRLLLEAHVAHRGTGDVGRAVAVCSSEAPDQEVLHTHRRLDPRHPQTIFGQISVDRVGYLHPGSEAVHPLDEQLHLPERSFSYELQRRLIKGAVQGPFDEAIERVEESTGVEIAKLSAEQMTQEAAQDFEAFYEQRTPPPQAQTGPIPGSGPGQALVGSADGKGIPMVKPQPAERVVRRGKGKKANKKKMAVVTTVYSLQPRVRTPEEVIESLFASGPRPAKDAGEPSEVRVRPEYKRVWASLTLGKQGVIEQMVQEMERRDPEHTKQWVTLTDGEKALQQAVEGRLPGIPLVLDFQHAMDKLWYAAYALHKEESPEARDWVKERALRLLRGEVSQVIQGMRQSATKRKLRGRKLKTVRAVAAYFYRNRDRMRYHDYLQKGWPIATGVVEGACKNLVKDRMERSGMRWKAPMAEAMLKLRATYLSGDLEEYWPFHIQREQERFHPPGQWRPVNSVDEK